MPDGKPPRDREGMRKAGYGVMIPVMFVTCGVVGVVLGSLIDKWANSAPWGVLIGLLLGLAAGIREMIRIIKKME